MKNIANQINQTIEDIWIILEKREKDYINLKINDQQYVLLNLIIRRPFTSPTELAKKMGITKSAVSQQLAKLEKEDYITRKQHVEDKRTFSIELGEKGVLYKKEMEAFHQQVSDKYHESLSPVELTNMLSMLQKLRELFE